MDSTSAANIALDKNYCPSCYCLFEEQVEYCPNDGALLRQTRHDPRIGQTFAERYEILSVIGLGGMSIVYLGRHKLMGRIVAIKMIHSVLYNDTRILERFRIEAQAASSLSHPNIITIYDFGVTDQGEAFLVMDYLEGESLAKLLAREGAVDCQRAVHYFRQLCEGLDAAHQKGIVHRDLKPANIILIKQPEQWESIKILDFGIAKFATFTGSVLHLTKAGESFGSPLYMSPEQCQGRPQDKRSDIYSLGCLMYEVLAGVAAFDSPTVRETLNLHVSGRHLPLSDLGFDAKIPLELCEIVEKCLEREPENRYQSCADILKDLALIAELPASKGSVWSLIGGPLNILGRARLRKKIFFGKVALVSFFLALGLLVFSVFSMWTGPQEDLGTAMSKLYWQVLLASGNNAIVREDYVQAERLFLHARKLASQFGDREHRLEVTLLLQADLYNCWEGHSDQLEKVNLELKKLYERILLQDYKTKMQILEEMGAKSSSAVLQSDRSMRSVAQVPSLVSCARKLLGSAFYLQAEKLLKKGIVVSEKLEPVNSISLGQLELMLGITLYQSRKISESRQHFQKAVAIFRPRREEEPRAYALALSKLGEVELSLMSYSQAQVAGAEELLSQALEFARKSRDANLILLTLRSYADLKLQTKQFAQSKLLQKEIEELEIRADSQPCVEK